MKHQYSTKNVTVITPDGCVPFIEKVERDKKAQLAKIQFETLKEFHETIVLVHRAMFGI